MTSTSAPAAFKPSLGTASSTYSKPSPARMATFLPRSLLVSTFMVHTSRARLIANSAPPLPSQEPNQQARRERQRPGGRMHVRQHAPVLATAPARDACALPGAGSHAAAP